MTPQHVSVFAVTLGDQVQEYGAYVGVAAFFGLAILIVLHFAQARELKRLRDWAGRSPEKLPELESRLEQVERGRTAAPAASAPVSPKPVPLAAPVARQGTVVHPAAAAIPAATAAATATAAAAMRAPAPVASPVAPVAAVAAGGGPEASATAVTVGGPPEAPATTAVTAGAPPESPASSTTTATAGTPPEAPGMATAASGPPESPDAATAQNGAGAGVNVARVAPPLAADRPVTPPPPRRRGPAPKRSDRSGLLTGLLGLGVVAALAGLVFLGLQLFGGEEAAPPPPPNQVADPVGGSGSGSGSGAGTSRPDATAARTETTVAVLNGTTSPGLAQSTSERLVGAGYAEDGKTATGPDQTLADSIVYFRRGRQRQARDAARVLGVRETEPMDADAQDLAGPNAELLVIVGADKTP